MEKMFVRTFAAVILMSGLVVAAVYAQQHDHDAAPAQSAARAPAPAEHPPEVFCGTIKTGQFCSMGTTTLLGLTAEKRTAWLAAVRQYNNAVNAAILALQADAKSSLSPAQVAEVNRWFAIGINPQINQLLAADSTKTGGAK